MRRLAPQLLLALLIATPAAAQDSRFYICSAVRPAPLGEVRADQLFSSSGETGARGTTWEAELAPNGIAIEAKWTGHAPAADPNGGLVRISFTPPRRSGYRMEIRREEEGPLNDLRLGGIVQSPYAGRIDWFTTWSALSGIAQGAPNLQVVILDSRGRIVRRAPINAASLAQVLALGVALQAEMDALAANYRNCDPLPVQTP